MPRVPLPSRSLLVLGVSALLAACGGGSSDSPSPGPGPGPVAPAPVPLDGGRLVYAVDGGVSSLRMFDETVASDRFVATDVPAAGDARLVLSTGGHTFALLDGSRLSVVSAGLEHLDDAEPHTHDVETVSPVAFSGVERVVATDHYFSILRSDGSSTLIDAEDGTEVGPSFPAVYPTLALAGGQYLRFTANAADASLTDLTVVEADGTSGADGLIFVRPNTDGFFTRSISCARGVEETVQTERFTVIRCGDGTLRWLASDFLAPEGHPAAGQRIHVTQRFPETATRRAGATGELPAGGNGFIENIEGLALTRSDDNVILAWAGEQLWIVNLHSDHSHRLSAYAALPAATRIIAVAASTEDDAVTVLGDDGRASTFRFLINASSNPEIAGSVVAEQLGASGTTWTTRRAQLLSGPFDFYVIDRDTRSLFHIDAHEPGDEYHLHATFTDDSLANARSAVYARGIGGDHAHE